jgi:hypothetical protein
MSTIDTLSLWCPGCGEPATARPPRSWTPAWGPRPDHAHLDGEPLCPVIGSTGYRPARPTRNRLGPDGATS